MEATFQAGVDLNLASFPAAADPAGLHIAAAGAGDERGQVRVGAGDGASATIDISPLRSALRRRAQDQAVLLPRPVPVDGVRATDLSRELARHRGVPEDARHEALSPRFSQRHRANTLANANATRGWRIYCDFAQSLIGIARRLYADEAFGVDLKDTVYALDATTIDLCLSVFPWAPFRSTKAAVKLHTLLDLRGNIPSFIHVSDGKMHDVNVLDQLAPEPGAVYVMDRGYIDFERLGRFHAMGSFFVIRAKRNLKAERRYSRKVDKSTGLVCDQTVTLTGFYSQQGFPAPLRRVRFNDPETGKRLVFLSNNFALPALTITQLYRQRWQIELFFK